MNRLVVVFVVTAVTVFPGRASDVTGETLAYACMGNVPNMKREKDTEKRLEFCHTYINAWDDARYSFLKGTRTFLSSVHHGKADECRFF